jgi:glycosyltransferase involved in cell wall biosynthesis
MNSLISICIPTYRRPDLLRVAVRSAVAQTYPEIEIIVGDDSPDSRSTQAIKALRETASCPIRYEHHQPGLGQNENVNRLFSLTRGDRLILLHDDDALLPDAALHLDSVWEPGTGIAFGFQQVISPEGQYLAEATQRLNDYYYRTVAVAGVQQSPLESALRQQIPNNGYLVLTKAARATGYRSYAEVGVYCDTDFSLRLASKLPPRSAVLIDQFTSQYRLSAESISNSALVHRSESPRAAVALYELVSSLPISPDIAPARQIFFTRMVDKVVKGYALAGQRWRALRVFFSKSYPVGKRLSAKGAYHFGLIIFSGLDRFRNYARDNG